jgi:hypothetical protein
MGLQEKKIAILFYMWWDFFLFWGMLHELALYLLISKRLKCKPMVEGYNKIWNWNNNHVLKAKGAYSKLNKVMKED